MNPADETKKWHPVCNDGVPYRFLSADQKKELQSEYPILDNLADFLWIRDADMTEVKPMRHPMKSKFQFNSHEDYVAACEQLAEDLVSFEADSMEFIITIKSAVENKETVQWLDTVAD